MDTPKRSYPFEKPWSPASRDPRFSRDTPDALRALVASKHNTGAIALSNEEWAALMIGTKARKTPVYDPARAPLIATLTRMAAPVEEESVDATREVNLASPMPAGPATRPETAVCQPPQRSVAGREACGPAAGSPMPPLGPLA